MSAGPDEGAAIGAVAVAAFGFAGVSAFLEMIFPAVAAFIIAISATVGISFVNRGKTAWNRCRVVASVSGGLYFLIGTYWAIFYSDCVAGKVFNAAVWSFGPPLWFYYETFRLVGKLGLCEADTKKGQDWAKTVWAGCGAFIVAMYRLSSH